MYVHAPYAVRVLQSIDLALFAIGIEIRRAPVTTANPSSFAFSCFVARFTAFVNRMAEQSLAFRDLERVPDDFVAQHAATCTQLDLTENMIKCVKMQFGNASMTSPHLTPACIPFAPCAATMVYDTDHQQMSLDLRSYSRLFSTRMTSKTCKHFRRCQSCKRSV